MTTPNLISYTQVNTNSTASVTVPANTQIAIYVFGGYVGGAGGWDITAVSMNSNAFTKLTGVADKSSAPSNSALGVWYLLSPTTGNMSITMTSGTYSRPGVMTFWNGIDTDNPFDGYGIGLDGTATFDSTAGSIGFGGANAGTGDPVLDAGMTALATYTTASGNDLAFGTITIPTTGSNSVIICSPGDIIGFALRESSAGQPLGKRLGGIPFTSQPIQSQYRW